MSNVTISLFVTFQVNRRANHTVSKLVKSILVSYSIKIDSYGNFRKKTAIFFKFILLKVTKDEPVEEQTNLVS